MILLQVATDTTHAATKVVGEMKLLDLLMNGGWIMVPIIICFLLTIYIFVERLITISKAGNVDSNFMNQIQDMVQRGKIEEARNFCRTKDTPITRMLDKALRKIGRPIDDIEKALESAGKMEVTKIEKNLSILGIIAGVAPMLGFVGTIAGVIRIFFEISQTNDFSISTISTGLYQKMITSAAGLVVGIIAHLCYHFLLIKIDREINKMEANSIEFIDLLTEPTA
ncbi:MAG: MotA/TolQ/ExbB proton channel family protein [Bacteroidetes bacterium]|nr:MotA/TolQ/ExbB proton channel family protein [Bacteroidota bacterium]